MPELHRQSRDCPGMATQPLGPLCQSIPEHQSYTSSPGIVLGWLPNPWDLSGRVSQNARVTPAVPGLSRDGYPTTLSERQSYTGSPGIVPGSDDYPTPGTFLSEYPRTPELHQQSWDGYPTPVTSLAGRVSQNARVTPAVPGLSRDDYPTPLSGYPRTLELHQQSWDCPGKATQPQGPLWQSIPERRSYTGSPGIVPG